MKSIASTIRVQDLDPCGLVAGIIDQMGLHEYHWNDRFNRSTDSRAASSGRYRKSEVVQGATSAPEPR
jgi:hypothetical protein